MDLREINYKAIPIIKKKLFPTMLMGELILFHTTDDGVVERVNKDRGKEDSDYKPNKVVNIIPVDNLKDVQEYFELSNFSKAQIEYIFKKLDLELIKFQNTELQNFVSFDSRVEFSHFEEEAQIKFEGMIDCYLNLKNILMQPSALSLDDLLKEQNRLTTKVTINEVYNHFKALTETTNKKNEFYLANEQLLIFIHSTFVIMKPIKQEFSCNGFQKKELRKVFYDFYFTYKQRETNETSIKRKYFNILNDSFDGFNENDYIDFHK